MPLWFSIVLSLLNGERGAFIDECRNLCHRLSSIASQANQQSISRWFANDAGYSGEMLHHIVKCEYVYSLCLLCLLIVILVYVLLKVVTQERLRVGFLVDWF